MKAIIQLLALVSLAYGKPSPKEVPVIRVSQDRTETSIPEIQIVFPDGHADNLILQRHYVSDLERLESKPNCNYLGHLERDVQACVAVTGCLGEDMEFTINSKHNYATNTYVLKTSGEVERIERPFGSEAKSVAEKVPEKIDNLDRFFFTIIETVGGDEEVDPDEIENEMEQEAICESHNTTGCLSMPATNELNLKMGYDDSFRNSFQSEEEAATYVSQLLTHSQAYFCMSSLGTKIGLKLAGLEHHPGGNWVAETRLQDTEMFQLCKEFPDDIDLCAFLSAPADLEETAGRGFLGTACINGGGWRTSITEKQSSIARTAGTFVHELGHNLGMNHDHDDVHKGRDCDGKGFMSYGNHAEEWSECSRADLLALYNLAKKETGTWCMAESPNVCDNVVMPESTTPPPPPAPTNCDLTRFQDGYCDSDLNNAGCGYDGGDCCVKKKWNWDKRCGDNCKCLGLDCPPYNMHKSWMGDKYCDKEFNTPGCFYDYGDCCKKHIGSWDEYCKDEPNLCQCLDPLHSDDASMVFNFGF